MVPFFLLSTCLALESSLVKEEKGEDRSLNLTINDSKEKS